jgi:uncharacterized protein YbbC (DUF1343 family)
MDAQVRPGNAALSMHTPSKRRGGPQEGCEIIARVPVLLGSERLLAASALDGKRVGLVCNPASVDHDFRHVADRVGAHPRARLAAIFGPQHGFRSDVQENMIETGHGID